MSVRKLKNCTINQSDVENGQENIKKTVTTYPHQIIFVLRLFFVLNMNKKSCVEWCKKRENHNKMTQKARNQKEKIILFLLIMNRNKRKPLMTTTTKMMKRNFN